MNNQLIIDKFKKEKFVWSIKGNTLREFDWTIDVYAQSENVLKKFAEWCEKNLYNLTKTRPALTYNYSKPVFAVVTKSVGNRFIHGEEMIEPAQLTNIIITTNYAQICEIVNKLEELNNA